MTARYRDRHTFTAVTDERGDYRVLLRVGMYRFYGKGAHGALRGGCSWVCRVSFWGDCENFQLPISNFQHDCRNWSLGVGSWKLEVGGLLRPTRARAGGAGQRWDGVLPHPVELVAVYRLVADALAVLVHPPE
jgi:hypothetical protein